MSDSLSDKNGVFGENGADLLQNGLQRGSALDVLLTRSETKRAGEYVIPVKGVR